VAIGLVLILIGAALFAAQMLGIIGIGGDRLALPEWLLPVVVIGIGVVVLGRGVLERRDA
jgi:hypothetical protein